MCVNGPRALHAHDLETKNQVSFSFFDVVLHNNTTRRHDILSCTLYVVEACLREGAGILVIAVCLRDR